MLDSRTKYYLDFATSIGIRCHQAITQGGIIAWYEKSEDREGNDFFFESLDEFGKFLIEHCRNNNLEFKPYKPGRGRGGKRINSGGKREGSGHPKGVSSPGSGRKPGFGRYGTEGGKLAWIPATMTLNDIERYRSMDDELQNLLNNYRALAAKSKHDSVTKKPTRDWTKALQLIDELNAEILKKDDDVYFS